MADFSVGHSSSLHQTFNVCTFRMYGTKGTILLPFSYINMSKGYVFGLSGRVVIPPPLTVFQTLTRVSTVTVIAVTKY